MPERGDVISFHRLAENVGAILDLVTERSRQDLEQDKSNRD